ncbi:MAG: hypothetical protein WKG07_05275 [Hymenobacter sp.]
MPLMPGATQTITVTANQTYYHRTAIWIDYNRDGVFANTTGPAGELVLNSFQSGECQRGGRGGARPAWATLGCAWW